MHPSPPILLDVESRVRGWTVTRVLDPTTDGMQEAVAEDEQGTPVLLRVPADADAIERIFAEAALARRHRHWGIVHTIGVVDKDGWPIQVIEHVDGMSLDTVGLLAGSLAPEAVCRVGWQIATVLAELHGEPGAYHGALSGERILVDASGHVRLADLGRARPEQLFRLLSPERRASGGAASPEDDLYALGGTLIEAALGRPLERTIGWIDTRALGGILPDRLIDALDALVAPSGRRLKNAAAVMRVFETIESSLGDGAVRLKKAVEYARLGAAVGRMPEPPRREVSSPDAATETEIAEGAPFVPFRETSFEQVQSTDLGTPPPFVPFADTASAPVDTAPVDTAPAPVDAAPDEPTSPVMAAVTEKEMPVISDQAAAFFASPPAALQRDDGASVTSDVEVERAPPHKKKWPLFSRMIAWGFMALVATNVLAALWVLAEPPLSRATGVALPKIPYADLSFEQMAQSAFASMAPDLGTPALALSAADLQDEPGRTWPLDAAPTEVAPVEPAPAEVDLKGPTTAEEREFAAALAALAAELDKAQPNLAEQAPAFDSAPTPGERPIGVPRRKSARPAASESVEAPAAPEKVAAPPAPKVAKPSAPEKVAKPTPSEKVVKPSAAEKVAKPSASEKVVKPATAERRIIGLGTGSAPAARPVKLTVEAPAAMRARAEAKLRDCELDEPVLGVIRVGSGGKVRSVSTDPLNACVAKTLKQTLDGFEEDAPFEITP